MWQWLSSHGVAEGKDEIKGRRIGSSEFLPVLRAQTINRILRDPQNIYNQRVQEIGRIHTGTEALKMSLS